MFLIEPCCTQKHWPALWNKLGESGTVLFHGYGDLSLAELLPVMLIRYSEVPMTLVAPSLPDAATKVLSHWLRKQMARMDGSGKDYVIGQLSVISDLREEKSPSASKWLKKNPFGERLVLHNIQQNDTALILPDIAIVGPVNLTYGGHFTALATKNVKTISALKDGYGRL